MLVITMQEDDVLTVGDDIHILVRRVKGGWVRLCIDAPREIPIRRVQKAPPAEEEARSSVSDVIVRRRIPAVR